VGDEKVDQIPLPTQVPGRPDVSNSIHSATVDSLLSQNLDLMTRLSINIRRVTGLETQLEKKEKRERDLSNEVAKLEEAHEILGRQFENSKDNISEAIERKQEAEKAFSTLYSKRQESQEMLESEVFSLRRETRILLNYRRRIQRYVRPLIDSIRWKLSRTFDIEKKFLQQSWVLKRHQKYRRRVQKTVRPLVDRQKIWLAELEKKNSRLELKVSEISGHLIDTCEHLQKKSIAMDEEKIQLVQYNEKRYTAVASELEIAKQKSKCTDQQLENAIRREQQAREKTEHMEGDLIVSENRSIKAQRALQEDGRKHAERVNGLENKVAELHGLWTQNRTQLEENKLMDSDGRNNRLKDQIQFLREENSRLLSHLKVAGKEPALKKPPLRKNKSPLPEMPSHIQKLSNKIDQLFREVQSGHSTSKTRDEGKPFTKKSVRPGSADHLVSEEGDLFP